VENIGIIFIGLGPRSLPRTACCSPRLAFTVAFLHVFNHSLFKSLLFFGAAPCCLRPANATWSISAASSIACRRPRSLS
jgi:formate hydrogenlyase subunit 3/multisubunit Na+/H+ antiporter MnhD subunit